MKFIMGVHYKKLLSKHNIHENQFSDSHDFTRRCKCIYIPYFPYSLTVTLLSGRPGNNSSEINCSGTYYERTEWCLEHRPHDRVANHTHSISHPKCLETQLNKTQHVLAVGRKDN
jgi:hypothetical protein